MTTVNLVDPNPVNAEDVAAWIVEQIRMILEEGAKPDAKRLVL